MNINAELVNHAFARATAVKPARRRIEWHYCASAIEECRRLEIALDAAIVRASKAEGKVAGLEVDLRLEKKKHNATMQRHCEERKAWAAQQEQIRWDYLAEARSHSATKARHLEERRSSKARDGLLIDAIARIEKDAVKAIYAVGVSFALVVVAALAWVWR